MRSLARRSIQTIKNRTDVVSSFVDSDTLNEFCVRRLSDRVSASRQLFIVTLNNDVSDGEVIPYAEIATSSSSKLRYVVKPSDQYPNLVDNRLMDKIETAISMYMKAHWTSCYH
ncbi:hypothetical protein CEQ31_016630 [Serratia odorifera]|uniref:Uncharacterized protein n=1 Tax=Serratia odorifera DSM 4582 TaxID=667129 RepID=D4E0N7_SEROD|nr:hypothetical protein HMPREF0758_1737 [Serratia odorifera DSM 4582]PNK91194.1 hypothetical protein CEQ31_016630 [Serratia odorifera]RII72292.1 hypothetical protein DX901_09785 [Serratia odorifera]